MSLFRRPSDSSSEDSDGEATSAQGSSNGYSVSPSNIGSSRGGVGASDGVSALSGAGIRSVSTSELQSEQSVGPGARTEDHRDIMLASLLEDHLRTLAAEALNKANPGKNYTRHSPEVQPLAQQLFRQTGQTLSSNNLLSSSSVSGGLQDIRQQYLSGLNNLVAGGLNPTTDLLNPMRDLVVQSSKLSLLPHPANDLQLTLQPTRRSHYLSNFEELTLLGKGAFGKVFECRNSLDQTKYAVKKIPLSPKLTKRFYEGNRGEMEELLREVKALAMLDHPNVVRYHATWIEQPWQTHMPIGNQVSPEFAHVVTSQPSQRRLLLDNRAFNASTDDEPSFSAGPEKSASYSGIVFGEDTVSHPIDGESKNSEAGGLQWSEQPSSHQKAVELLSSDDSNSDVFTDGKGVAHSNDVHSMQGVNDGTHVLYIQMSLYPMTLAQYLSPSLSADSAKLKHCYHLLPTLRLLLAILTGLQYIHANHLLHRDIKPGNIFLSNPKMISDNGYCDVSCHSCVKTCNGVFNRWLNPRIGDFGLVAELAKEGLMDEATSHKPGSDAHKPVGTAYYRPPEWRGADDSAGSSGRNMGPIDEKIDMFALGVILVEMLWPCGTAMERVDMLKGLQMGFLPSGLGHKLEAEGFDAPTTEEVLTLSRAMVDPNPFERWADGRVKVTIERLLGRISDTPT